MIYIVILFISVHQYAQRPHPLIIMNTSRVVPLLLPHLNVKRTVAVSTIQGIVIMRGHILYTSSIMWYYFYSNCELSPHCNWCSTHSVCLPLGTCCSNIGGIECCDNINPTCLTSYCVREQG